MNCFLCIIILNSVIYSVINIIDCPADIKRTAYLTLVRLIMEYAAPGWDPYYNIDISDIYKLEKVQRRAA